MRKVIYGGGCSLDEFVAGLDGALDWLHFSKDVREVMAKSWASADTILMGRKTWEGAAGSGGGAVKGIKSYVFSRTLTRVPGKGVELVTADAGEFVRRLKAQPGKDILVMSGGNFATSLLKAGVIDEIGLNVHPVLLGSGVPAFLDAGARTKLELTECRQLDGGCVLVTYAVRH
ncbi:MAG: dihydrofolate reductase family protein [Acidobacteriota bacterium]|nr:dihydrofolate reductase family protein [Acidobacteriota bacterium]